MMTDSNTARERPILFSAPMVRAILAGEKTVTRRVVKLPGYDGGHVHEAQDGRILPVETFCPFGGIGDRLWVKETWQALKFYRDWETGIVEDIDFAPKIPKSNEGGRWTACYAADDNWEANGEDRGFPWRPSIFMPRWASRITLEITSIRAERLQSITEEDALAEGVELLPCNYVAQCRSNSCPRHGVFDPGRRAFEKLWDSINGKTCPWESNPFVWAVSFRRLEGGAL